MKSTEIEFTQTRSPCFRGLLTGEQNSCKVIQQPGIEAEMTIPLNSQRPGDAVPSRDRRNLSTVQVGDHQRTGDHWICTEQPLRAISCGHFGVAKIRRHHWRELSSQCVTSADRVLIVRAACHDALNRRAGLQLLSELLISRVGRQHLRAKVDEFAVGIFEHPKFPKGTAERIEVQHRAGAGEVVLFGCCPESGSDSGQRLWSSVAQS